MKVLKFGGTSVGTAESIRNVKDIITAQGGGKIVVLSAMSGVTNELVNLTEYFRMGIQSSMAEILERLRQKHRNLIEELFLDSEAKADTLSQIEQMFGQLEEVVSRTYNAELDPVVLTFGESFLTFIFSKYLEAEEVNNTLLDAKDFMHVQSLENPNIDTVETLLKQTFTREIRSEIYITQGFIRIDRFRNINTLKRGGSDYSATILAAACGAKEVQIWTDIDGFHNNDPRYVENTTALSHLTFEEAAELAYFGAKILHPQTVQPAKERNIPIYLKNTFTPTAAGTKISSEIISTGLKAISAKDGITAIKIKSNRMLMAHGFLRKIFDVFDKHQTAIDMITTSEIAISLTIDDVRNLDLILNELEAYGEIIVEKDHSIICIVGESLIEDKNISRIFELLNDIPVRMISYGGSKNNISLLVDTKNKVHILQSLNQKLFANPPKAAAS